MAMSQIFVSYSRKDAQFVTRLVADLEADGWDVFYDRKLVPSEKYDERLPEELARARFIVVVLSPHSLASTNVLKELRAALLLESEQKTTVIPVLMQPCDDNKLRSAIGTRIYADFTTDYQSGFTELGTTLSGSRKTPGREVKNGEAEGKKSMPIKEGIVVAVIGAIVALVTAYWQFVYKQAPPPPPSEAQYAGRVIDSVTQNKIKGAKVSVDTQGAPQIYHSDTEGVFSITFPSTVNSAHIVVEAQGYERFDRNVTLPRTGVEDIRLTPVAPKTSPTSSPEPTRPRKPVNTRTQDARIKRILESSNSNKPN
jgi:TIR domain